MRIIQLEFPSVQMLGRFVDAVDRTDTRLLQRELPGVLHHKVHRRRVRGSDIDDIHL